MTIKETIIVEGTYDKIKLASIVDANIVTTNGFDILNNEEKLNYIQKLAKTCGIVIFTDSDSAGFRIRSYLKGTIKEGRVLHAYAPDITGKERRKRKASAEGLLGIEGLDAKVIVNALAAAGCGNDAGKPLRPITKLDLFEAGLAGGKDSAQKRRAFAAELGLPSRISSNSLVGALNSLMSYEDFSEKVKNNYK